MGTDILATIMITLLILSFAVTFTLMFRPLYYFDINHLSIPASSGYSEAEIRANYDALIDYNSVFYQGDLEFPTLGMSKAGQIHFAEVKQIFSAIQIMLCALTLPVAAIVIYKLRKREIRFLKFSAICAVGLPLLLGLLIALNWNAFFVMFHQIFFRNDFWQFDPVLDPVINILPDGFFMHCAIMILGIVLAMALLLLVVWRVLRKRPQKQS